MEKFVVPAPGVTVGSGEVIGLNAEQLALRGHAVEDLGRHGKWTRVRVLAPQQFKAGEEVLFERLPKGLQGTGGAEPDAPAPKPAKGKAGGAEIEAARREGRASGRAEMLAEVAARNALFDAEVLADEAVDGAQAALDAEADPEKRVLLQAALDAALAAQAKAVAAVEALPELEA